MKAIVGKPEYGNTWRKPIVGAGVRISIIEKESDDNYLCAVPSVGWVLINESKLEIKDERTNHKN